jgi:hypothetical protein
MHRLQCVSFLFALFLLATGCNSTTTAPIAASDVYPLTTGSVWKYTSSLADTVSGTDVISGREYAVIHGTLFRYLFARTNNRGQLLVRETENDPESVLFDFQAPVGSAWTAAASPGSPAPTVTLVSKTDAVTVPAGTYTGCYTFFYDVSDDIASDITYVVAPGVGLVYVLLHSGVSYSLEQYVPGTS